MTQFYCVNLFPDVYATICTLKKKTDCSPLSILAIIGIRIHDFLLPIDISTVSECV